MNRCLAPLAGLAGLTTLALGLGFGLTAHPARAIDLDQACARFASKLTAAVQSGDSAKAQKTYQVGSQRIASRFNGATCPNVQAPAAPPSN